MINSRNTYRIYKVHIVFTKKAREQCLGNWIGRRNSNSFDVGVKFIDFALSDEFAGIY